MNQEDILLKALYAEAIHHGDFNEVTSGKLGMEKKDFGWALYVLQMRGLIAGCRFQPPTPTTPGAIMGVIRTNMMITPKGFEQVEAELGAGETAEQLDKLWRFFRDLGVSIMANAVWSWL